MGAICAALVLLAPAAQGQDNPRRMPQHRGEIGVMPQGLYVCELPDEHAASRGVEQPGTSFRITSASRYTSDLGTGTYLRRGDTMVLSSGPRAGERYQVIGDGFIRRLENGTPSRLRCLHRGR